MNSACQNAVITEFLWDLPKKAFFSPNFCPYYIVWWSEGYEPKHWSMPFWLNLAFFHLKNFRENHNKIRNNDNRYFILFLAFFLKSRSVELGFHCRNEFCMPKYPSNCFFMGFAEKAFFPWIFAIRRPWDKKLINTILAELGFFPSKKHDSIVFKQFCL